MGVGVGRQVERLEPVAAEALGILFRRQLVPQLRVVELRRRPEHVAARHVEIAAQRHQDQQRARRLEGVVAELVGAVAPDDAARLRGGVDPRRPRDLFGVAPGDLGHPVERILLQPLAQLVEAVAVLFDELPVVEPLVDHYPHPAERHRGVGAGPERQPDVAAARRCRFARVDHDVDVLLLERVGHRLVADQPVVVAGAFLRAPFDDASGVGVEIRHRDGVPRFAGVLAGGRHLADRDPGPVAEIADGDDVGRAEQVGETRDDVGVVDTGAAPESHRLGAVALLRLLHLLGDQGERLVPARLAPLSGAAFAGADQRAVEPVGVVELLDRGRPRLRAQQPLVDRVREIAEHAPDGAVHLLDDGAAAAMAHAADRLEAFHEVAPDPLRLVGPRSHSRPPRQGADDPSTGGGDQGGRAHGPPVPFDVALL